MKKSILLIVLFAVIAVTSYAEDLPVIRSSSFVGKHFLIGFMQNEIAILDEKAGINLEMFITATYNAKITVKIPGLPTRHYEIGIDSVLRIRVPDSLEVREQEEAISKAVEVTADYPISIFCFSSQNQTSDGFTAIPVANWGNEYIVVSMPNDQYHHTDGRDSAFSVTPRRSEFMIISGFDSTEVDFTPTSVTAKGKQFGQNYKVMLKKGELYLVQSLPAGMGFGDLSGTIVRSSKPIGVISGHVRTSVPQYFPHPNDTKDHLCEMLPPTKSWGRQFVTAPFEIIDAPKGDLFKLFNIDPGTEVIVETATKKDKYFFGMPGSFLSIVVTEPAIWKANSPIQVAQFMTHKEPYDSKKYDPSMVIIPPIEQFVQRVVFSTPGNIVKPDQFDSHNCVIVANKNAVHNIKIDGRKLTAFTNIADQRIIETDYYNCTFKIVAGKHILTCDSGGFAGIVFGQGNADSYAMMLGSSLTNPYKNDVNPPNVSAKIECGKLDGYVVETIDSNTTGINYIWVVEDSTNNYTWHVDPIYDTSNYVRFYAEPENIYQDGRFMMDLYDKNGNGRRYVHIYNGIKLTIPNEIRFDKIMWDESACRTFTLANRGGGNVKIKSFWYSGDNRVKITPEKIYPYSLVSKDSVNYVLCYEPNGDSTSFYGEIELDIECDKKYIVKVIGNVQAPMLEARGYDFGKVRVGDTVCNWITITNKGNINIRIDSLKYVLASSRFLPDTSKKFPLIVPAQDSVKIKVCFTPDSVGYFDLIAKAVNEMGLDNMIIFEGYGIAPSVKPITVDWKRRRVGTSNDTTVYLVNTGEAAVKLNFDTFETATVTDKTTEALGKINTTLAQDDSLKLDLNFTPANTQPYNIIGKIKTDWRFHPNLFVETVGLGTLPEITVYDFDFDSIYVNSSKSELVELALAGGNENLTVDEVTIESGDEDSFEIDLDLLTNKVLPPTDKLTALVNFVPKRRGLHEITLSVKHDANPSYQRSESLLKIRGFAMEIGAETTLNGDFDKAACQLDTTVFAIENLGNIPLTLTSVDIAPAAFRARWITAPQVPYTYLPSEKKTFGIEVFPLRDDSGILKVNTIFNDTINHTTEIDIEPTVLSLDVNNIDGLEFEVGDTVSITFGGKFPSMTDIKTDFEIKINADRNFLFLKSSSAIVTVTDGRSTQNLPATLTHVDNDIFIRLVADSLQLSGESEWNVLLDFFVLLPDSLGQNIKVSATSNLCFLPDEQNIFAKIKKICIFNLRSVKLITNLPKLKVAPNPIIENLNAEIYMPEDGYVDLSIIDGLGKNISLKSNLYLKKGSHSLIFEINTLANGTYMFVLKTPNLIRQSMFIITK